MDSLLDFSGQVALITGAGSGFGRLLSKGLAERGCKLVISDIDPKGLAETVANLSDYANNVIAQHCDVAKEADCKAMVDSAMDKFGRVDIGVNNAGIAHSMAPMHTLDEATIDKQMDVNVKGVMFGMKHQIEVMLKQGSGHILNVSSLAGLGGAPKGAAYSAAKHAVIGLTKTAAIEYARKGIRANSICPFYTPTNILNIDGQISEEGITQLAVGCPMKRLATPQEIVNAMLLVLSPGNTYMTGQSIALDGGVTAW
jgi:NAD(P)-dependent dehydrogenase (short-subunit alcohol dehydrogenase family)